MLKSNVWFDIVSPEATATLEENLDHNSYQKPHVSTEDNQDEDSDWDDNTHVDIVGKFWINEVKNTIEWGNKNQEKKR